MYICLSLTLLLMVLMFAVFHVFMCKKVAKSFGGLRYRVPAARLWQPHKRQLGPEGSPDIFVRLYSWPLRSRTDCLGCRMETLVLFTCWHLCHCPDTTSLRHLACLTTQQWLKTQAYAAGFPVGFPDLRQRFTCEREKRGRIYPSYI